jgi:hypothetical protein
MRLSKCLLPGALCALSVIGSAANGAVIVTNVQDVAPAGGNPGDPYTPSAFTASSSDLLSGLTPLSATGNTTQEGAVGVSRWTDGSIATLYAKQPNTGQNLIDNHVPYGTLTANPTLTPPTTAQVVYDLGGLYNLSSADVFAGWNDSGRDLFSFTLDTSADNVNYSPIGSFNKNGDNTGAITTPVTTKIDFVDDGGAPIASGVRYLRLTATDTDNGYAGMVEIDAQGTAVPEPASLAVLGMGGLLMMRRRR